MLELELPANEFWDQETESFLKTKATVLEMEHSLISLSKWEAKWNIPFWGDAEKTPEQVLHYFQCMTINRKVDPLVFNSLTPDHIATINEYIAAPMTATTIKEAPGAKKSNQFVTSELVYSWMIALNIPFECRTWHLNRLLMLIRVCNEKNQPEKKSRMSRSQILAENRRINEQNRAKYRTSG